MSFLGYILAARSLDEPWWPDPPALPWRRTVRPPLASLDSLLRGSELEPPHARSLAVLFRGLEDAVIEDFPSLRHLAWLVLQSGEVFSAGSVLRELGCACGQVHPVMMGEIGLRIDYASAVEALRIVRAVIAGEDPSTDPDAWTARVDAYGLAVYGEARGWVDRPGLSRELAEVASVDAGGVKDPEDLLEGVARRAVTMVDEHERGGVCRELWNVLDMDAEQLARLGRMWARRGGFCFPG